MLAGSILMAIKQADTYQDGGHGEQQVQKGQKQAGMADLPAGKGECRKIQRFLQGMWRGMIHHQQYGKHCQRQQSSQ
ncbi:MAG: hypothetical protein R3E95_01790 [Thiolinea sp.]